MSGRGVTPADALEASPVKPLGGVPIAADADHIWISDYERIATYDRSSGEWVTANVPFPLEQLAGMRIAPVAGHAVVLALHCEGRCDAEEQEVPAEIVVWSLVDPTHLEALRTEGPAGGSVPGSSLTLRYDAPSDEARFGVNAGDAVVLLDVAADGSVSSTRVAGSFGLVCPHGEDILGVERVSHAMSSSEPPGPLRVVEGPASSPDPVALPAGAAGVLADQVWLGMACVHGGLALVGRMSAATFDGTSWSTEPSGLTREPMGSAAGQVEVLPDGTLLAATGNGTLVRSPAGVWGSDTDPFAIRVAMGDQVLTYRLPQPAPD